MWGINVENIHKKLLQKSDLTYEQAVGIAQGAKTAEQNLKEMRALVQELEASHSAGATTQTKLVHKALGNKSRPKDSGIKCHRCGISGHVATACRLQMQGTFS